MCLQEFWTDNINKAQLILSLITSLDDECTLQPCWENPLGIFAISNPVGNKLDVNLLIIHWKISSIESPEYLTKCVTHSKIFSYFLAQAKNERNTMLHLRKAIKERSVSNVLLLIQEYWNFLKLYLLSVQFVLSHLLHTLVHNKKTSQCYHYCT